MREVPVDPKPCGRKVPMTLPSPKLPDACRRGGRVRPCPPGGWRAAFTLVELLVVVFIIEILLSTALPLYLSTAQDAQKRTCRTNMQTIADAVQAARVKTMSSSYTTIISNGITTANLQDLQTLPVCPNGGTYTLASTTAGFKVSCSYAGPPSHGTFQPGVDSQ